MLPVTSPLRLTKDIDDCIKIFKSKKCDGVITITPSSKNPYFNMVQINKRNLNLINKIIAKKKFLLDRNQRYMT